jgi:hypothetical protein
MNQRLIDDFGRAQSPIYVTPTRLNKTACLAYIDVDRDILRNSRQ